MKIRTILPWFGGKRKMARRIARECCQQDGTPPKSFWEKCCGGCAVTLAMPRCAHMTVVDKHPALMNLIRVIQDPVLGPQLYRRLRRVVCHSEVFDDARQALTAATASLFGGGELAPIDAAFHYFVASWMGRNGVSGAKRALQSMAIRWTSGGGHGGVRFAGAVDSIPSWRRRMRDITALQMDIFYTMEKVEDQEGTSIYIDPTYLFDEQHRSGNCQYEYEFSPRDHARLAAAARRFNKGRLVISYYDHPLLRELYDGWTFVHHPTKKNLHVQNRRGVGSVDVPEILIINGPSWTTGDPEYDPLAIPADAPAGDGAVPTVEGEAHGVEAAAGAG